MIRYTRCERCWRYGSGLMRNVNATVCALIERTSLRSMIPVETRDFCTAAAANAVRVSQCVNNFYLSQST